MNQKQTIGKAMTFYQVMKYNQLQIDKVKCDVYNGNQTRTAKTFNEIYFEKYNHFHDKRGRFASGSGFGDLGRRVLSQLGQGAGKSGFVNANSLSEAAQYAKQNLGFDKVIWNDLSLESANFINEHITNVQAKFPETKEAVSTLKVVDDTRDEASNAYIATNENGKMTLGINKYYFNDIEQYNRVCQYDYETGHSSSGSAEGTIWHEYGHVMTTIQLKRSMGYRPKEVIKNIDAQREFVHKTNSFAYENEVISMAAYKLGSNSTLMSRSISRYAKTDLGETFAEAFSDVYTNSVPKKESLAIIGEAGLLR